MSNKKSDKPWYEKVNIWIGIIAGVCTILAFICTLNQYASIDTIVISDDNEITTYDYSTGITNDNNEDKVIQSQENDSDVNVYINNNIISQSDNNETVSDEYITEPFNIDSLQTSSYIKIQVRNNSTGYPAWNNITSINDGDQIEFQIEYKNTSKYEQKDVVILNSLPKNVKYVEGTLKKHDANNPNGINLNPDELFTEKGLNIGDFMPDTNTYINFTVEVINADWNNGRKTLLNELKYEIGTEKYTISQDYTYGSLGGWGPERPIYTMKEPADHAVFNSIIDNAAIGDERDFVRIAEKNAGTVFSSEIILEPGKQYSVFIYYHNNVSATYNDEGHNYIGFAENTRVYSTFPSSLEKGERQTVFGYISSTNTDPKAVWDSAFITAREAMTLHYVPDSAKIYNSKDANNSILPTNLFSYEGTFIGTNKLNGLIPGCDEYAGTIFYTIQTMPVENKDE